ncbi:MAG: hypothetical protein LJE62_10335 [Silicimonas sp.]|jgi:membrane protein implicated in regulation of membrane protease activity|nr:hypothetical protein [Silicimonas sp.]
MAQGPQPEFLEREAYRRRRLADAARVLPFFGLVLLLLPGLWQTTSGALVYIFTVWGVLILIAAWLSRQLARRPPDDGSRSYAGDPDQTAPAGTRE